MEQNRKEGSLRTQEDIQYFGSYFNMARHNLYLITNHLTSVFSHLNFSQLDDDEDIWSDKPEVNEKNILLNIFDTKNERLQDERIRVFRYLMRRHHLPCLRIFTNDFKVLETTGNTIKKDELEVDFDAVHKFLNIAFKEINLFRNSYTHYLSINEEGKRLKKKKKISSKLVPVLNSLFSYAPEYSFLRHNIDKANKDVKIYKEEVKEYYDNIKSKYKLFENDSNELTDQGMYFFITLFLERAHGIKFLKRFRGFKNETTPPFKATIQAFTTYTLKIPDVRLDNDIPEQTMIMEVLNELNKCPEELFKFLKKEDKDRFQPVISDESLTNIINSSNYEEISDEDIDRLIKENSVLKRREDRFPYFALQYLEIMSKLKNIRFQIYLGKLVLKTYDKENPNIERRVITDIHAFGKLSDFVGKEAEVLDTFNSQLKDYGYSVAWDQYKPSYAIEMNRIGFYLFNDQGDKVENKILPSLRKNKNLERKVEIKVNKIQPTGFISTHMLPKFLISYLMGDVNEKNGEKTITHFLEKVNVSILDQNIINQIKSEIQNLDPIEFTKRCPKLSAIKNVKKLRVAGAIDKKIVEYQYINDTDIAKLVQKTGLAYDTMVTYSKDKFKEKTNHLNLSKKELETFAHIKYKYYLSERRKALDSVLKAYFPEIGSQDIPKELYNYLLNINEQDNKKLEHRRIKDEVTKTKKLIKDVNRSLKFEDKILLGDLATKIARDIINMIIDKDLKVSMTNPFANRLQNLIAYFSTNKEAIVALCESYKVFEHNKGHFFLTRELILNSTGVIDFYIRYFEAKIEKIKEVLLVRGKEGGYEINTELIPYSYTQYLPKEVKEENKNTCKNLFEQWLYYKQKSPVNLPVTLLDEDLTSALKSKLKLKPDLKDGFSKLIQLYLKDDAQEFYSFDRVYRNNDNEHVIKYSNEGSSKEMQIKYGKVAVESEKIIRHVLLKDRILRVICEDLLKSDKNTSSTKSFLLKDISPWSETNILNKPNEFSYNLRKNIDGSGTEYCTIVAKDSTEQIRQINEWNDLSKEIKSKFLKLNAEQKIDFLTTQDEKTKLVLLGQQNYQWKFSDFGRFRRFMKDKRINEMVKYFEPKQIPFDLLEFQILQYNIYREKMFDKIFELERVMSERYFEDIKSKHLENFKYNEVGFQTYLNVLSEKIASGYDIAILKWGRNKFSHTEIVYYNFISKIAVQDIEEFELKKHLEGYKENVSFNIARNIYRVFSREVDKTINLINNSFKI